jgi:lysozyme
MDMKAMRAELLHDEGLLLSPYRDSLGYWTIGVGHLLHYDPAVNAPRMTSITYDEAMALLDADINKAVIVAKKYAPALFDLSQGVSFDVRVRAVVNMAFNLGPKLGDFHHFLESVNAFDWETAGRQMMESKWAKQVGKRAERLKHMIETGETA